MVSLSTSIYFAGVMIGGVIFGAASDSLGRFPVIVFTLFIPVILGVMLFFVESFILFIIIRCLIGVCMQVRKIQLWYFHQACVCFPARYIIFEFKRN